MARPKRALTEDGSDQVLLVAYHVKRRKGQTEATESPSQAIESESTPDSDSEARLEEVGGEKSARSISSQSNTSADSNDGDEETSSPAQLTSATLLVGNATTSPSSSSSSSSAASDQSLASSSEEDTSEDGSSEDGSVDDDDGLDAPTTVPHLSAQSHADLTSRLLAFLPAMAAANEDLERAQQSGNAAQHNLETVDEGRYIEMNLGLGVLEERASDESEKDNELLTEVVERSASDPDLKDARQQQADAGREALETLMDIHNDQAKPHIEILSDVT